VRPSRFGSLALFACLAALGFTLSARADAPASSLSRLLAVPGRRHALADRGGRIPITVALPFGADASSLGLLPVAPGIGAARLDPEALGAFSALHPELSLGVAPPRRPLLDVSNETWTRAQGFRNATGNDGSGVIVGVIDTGLDISHPDFRDKDGKTRIAWFLNAEPPRGLHPDLESTFGCAAPKQSACAIYSAEDINALLAKGDTSIHDPIGHGTHVASIAAGNGGPMSTPTPRYVGVAPGATLIVASPSADGGFFDPDVLNAARFIFDRADHCAEWSEHCAPTKQDDPPKRRLPAVINISIGGDFGPHDGTSAIEKGLSAMVGDDQPGRAIVTAAGNSGALSELDDGRGPLGVHTEVQVSPDGVTRVPLLASAAKDGQAFIWITFRPGDDIAVALEGLGGLRWIDFTERGKEAGYKGDDGTAAGVINNHISKTSSITSDTNSAVVVIDGSWPDLSEFAVLLRGTGQAQLWVVGTGDVGEGAPLGVLFQRAVKQGTIAVPASAPNLLAVGCTLNRLTWKPLGAEKDIELAEIGGDKHPVADGACYFSAMGPTPLGVQKPEISAPGGFVVAALSAEADPRKIKGGLFESDACPTQEPCFLVDERHAMSSGTSMSAPHVTGAVALLFQLDPTLTQARVTDVLQAGARKPSGHVPFASQLGPGELDLEGARQVLADQSSSIAPSLEKSWYTLSSVYARPDPSWPIWGTIELRRADDTIASGLDGNRLALSVEGGVVVQPVTRIRPGMWRFAVAGTADGLSEALVVDVIYDGASLGVQTLPIGTDIWNADAMIHAVGGCASSPAGLRGAGAASAVAALAALALVAARARRRR
jgi:subtilisin family serine protease